MSIRAGYEVEILEAVGETGLFGREFDESEDDLGRRSVLEIDIGYSFGEERGVERGGDDGGLDASGC